MKLKVLIAGVLLGVTCVGTMSVASAAPKAGGIYVPDAAMDCIFDPTNKRWICSPPTTEK